MASERQIAANRRNAANSSGPRSRSGKKRAGQNAFRHGLTLPMSSAEFGLKRETLARQIAGDTQDRVILELARDAADAKLELDRVRHVRRALIARVAALGGLEAPKRFYSKQDELKWVMQRYLGITIGKLPPRMAIDPLPPMPEPEPQRSAEAIRRILPELLRMNRYESRAVARRDRAVRAIALGGKMK